LKTPYFNTMLGTRSGVYNKHIRQTLRKISDFILYNIDLSRPRSLPNRSL